MSKEKEEFKEKVKGEKEKIIADEDQMTDISDEEIEPADELLCARYFRPLKKELRQAY